MLRTVRTVIVDEIHAVVGDKRGAHLALSLERLGARGERPLQRIGLSATQKPIEDVARSSSGRDVGADGAPTASSSTRPPPRPRPRARDPAIAARSRMSHEMWVEGLRAHGRADREHRTTLVFVNTRKLAERVAQQLSRAPRGGEVAAHHGSLSKERRLEAEQRLKRGELQALVATASLELGIDIGHVDLVSQIGSPRAHRDVAAARRPLRAHGGGQARRAACFPVTRDELMECCRDAEGGRAGKLDRTGRSPRLPSTSSRNRSSRAVHRRRGERGRSQRGRALRARAARAGPYRELTRERFDAVVAHAGQRVQTASVAIWPPIRQPSWRQGSDPVGGTGSRPAVATSADRRSIRPPR